MGIFLLDHATTIGTFSLDRYDAISSSPLDRAATIGTLSLDRATMISSASLDYNAITIVSSALDHTTMILLDTRSANMCALLGSLQ